MPTTPSGTTYVNIRPDIEVVERLHSVRADLAPLYRVQHGGSLTLTGLAVAMVETTLVQPQMWRPHFIGSDRVAQRYRCRGTIGLIVPNGLLSRVSAEVDGLRDGTRVGVMTACLTAAMDAIAVDATRSPSPDATGCGVRLSALLDAVEVRRLSRVRPFAG